jgi:hypothetical protein
MNLVLLGAMTFDTILAGARVIGHRQIPVIGSRAAGDAERVTPVHARATDESPDPGVAGSPDRVA